MPAIITHNLFGREAYIRNFETLIQTSEELDAYLLGNQGPDPLFFRCRGRISQIKQAHRLASRLHNEHMSDAFEWLRRSVDLLPTEDRGIGRAFALGYLAHYILDRTAHPYIFATQYELMDIDASLENSGGCVHGVIEADIDSILLQKMLHKTPDQINIAGILGASNRVLRISGALVSQMIRGSLNAEFSPLEFGACVGDMRFLYSKIEPLGSAWSEAIRTAETLKRDHSQVQSLCHRTVEVDNSILNTDHYLWQDPSTQAMRSESFYDLYTQAQEAYVEAAQEFLGKENPVSYTHHISFDGRHLDTDENPKPKRKS